MIVHQIENEDEWKRFRAPLQTASEAGRYCGVDQWMVNSRYHYWEEKCGIRKREDISQKPAVLFGKKAEEYVRSIYQLMTGANIEYHPYWMYSPDDRPWMGATLDGIDHAEGGDDIIEIKTSTERNYRKHWTEEDVPDDYLCQVCHQLICYTPAKGTRLLVLHYDREGRPRHLAGLESYYFPREELEENIQFVQEKADEMHGLIERKEPPKMTAGGYQWRTL